MTFSRIAFINPQGNLILKDSKYITMQGSTAENGGQVIYVIEMGIALAKKGVNVDIFARNYDTDELITEEHPEYPELTIYHIPTKAPHVIEKENFYPYYPEFAARAFQIVDEHDLEYDAIVGHYADGMFLSATLEEMLFNKSGLHVPLVSATHSLGLEKAATAYEKLQSESIGSETLCARFNKQVDRFNIRARLACEIAALARHDGVACVSNEHMRRLFKEYGYPEDQRSLIPGGVNSSVFRKIANTDLQKKSLRVKLLKGLQSDIGLDEERTANIADGQIVFGFGRFVEAKGILNAVKSFKTLLEKSPDAYYLYAGGNIHSGMQSDEEKKLYEECIAYAKVNGFEDRVIFLGRQDQQTISRWLNASDVYLHAAFLEPFGLAPQEAAATGIPVVVSQNAGVAECLQNERESLHVNPHSPVDIAKQVGRILRNPDFGRRISLGAAKYIACYASYDTRADDLLAFLAEVKEEYLPLRQNRGETALPANDNACAAAALSQLNRENGRDLDDALRPYFDSARNTINRIIKTGTDEFSIAPILNPSLKTQKSEL